MASLSRSSSDPAPPPAAQAVAAELRALGTLTDAESQQLGAAGVQTADELWRKVGESPEDGIDQLATATGIPRQRLLKILVVLTKAEAANLHVHRARRILRTLQARWLDVALIGGVTALLFLALRASGKLDGLQPPLGLQNRVIVAARDLEAGRVLQRDDLISAQLRPQADQFSQADTVVGLVLQKALSRGGTLRFEGVLRRQLVATKDIPAGTVITEDAATVALSPFHPDATDNPAQIVNHKSLRGVHAGELLLPKFVD